MTLMSTIAVLDYTWGGCVQGHVTSLKNWKRMWLVINCLFENKVLITVTAQLQVKVTVTV